MKNSTFFRLLPCLICFFISSLNPNAYGTVIQSATNGNWNVASTWAALGRTGTITTTSGSSTVTGVGTLFTTELAVGSIIAGVGTVNSITNATTLVLTSATTSIITGAGYTAQVVPLTTDDAIISGGNTVTAAVSATITNLTVFVNGVIDINSGITLTNTGNLICNGTIQDGTAGGIFAMATTSTKNIDGSGSVITSGTNTISVTRTILATANITFSNLTATAGAITNNGTLTMIGLLAGSTVGFSNATGSTLIIQGVVPTIALTPATTTNLVKYNGASQTVKAATYFSLEIAETGGTTATMVSSLSVTNLILTSGILTVGSSSNSLSLMGGPNSVICTGGTLTGTSSSTIALGSTSTGNLGTLNINGSLVLNALQLSSTTGGTIPQLTISGGNITVTSLTATVAGKGIMNFGNNTLTYTNSVAQFTTVPGNANCYFAFNGSSGGFILNPSGGQSANQTATFPIGIAGTINGYRPIKFETPSTTSSSVNFEVGFISHSGGTTASPTNLPANTNNRVDYIAMVNPNNTTTGYAFSLSYQNADFIYGTPTAANVVFNIWQTGGTPSTSWSSLAPSSTSGASPIFINEVQSSNFPANAFNVTLSEAGVSIYNWNGGTTQWNTTTNWTPNVVPSSSTYLYIPSAPANQPLINAASGDGTVKALVVEPSATVMVTGQTLTVSYNFTCNGTVSGTGTLSLTGNASIIDGGSSGAHSTLSINTVNLAVGAAQTKTITGTAFIDLTGTTVAIAGSNTITNYGTINITGSLTGGVTADTWTNASGSSFTVGGTVLATGTISAANQNTVIYNGTSQTVKTGTYATLIINQSGGTMATMGGAVTVNANLTIQNGTLADGTNLLAGGTIASLLDMSTSNTTALTLTNTTSNPFPTFRSYTLHPTASTVNFNANAAQYIRSLAYGNLVIAGGNRKVLLGPITVNNNLIINTGVLSDSSYQIIGNATGTLTVGSNDTLQVGSGTLGTTFPTNFTNAHISLGAGSRVIYGANADQTISNVPATYVNLSISGTPGTKTSVNTLSVSGNLTISPAASLTLDQGLSTVASFIGSTTSTLNIADGGSAFSLSLPAIAVGLGTLTLNRSAGVVLNAALTLTNNPSLILTNGRLTTTSNNLLTITSTVSGSVSGGGTATFVYGPMSRTLPASLASAATYYFPIGDTATTPSYNPLDAVSPTTSAGGTVTVFAQVFNADAGGKPGPRVYSLYTNRYWYGSITAGINNLTSIGNIGLTDAAVSLINDTNYVCYSTTKTGYYALLNSFVSGIVVTTNNGAPPALGYFVIGSIDTSFKFNQPIYNVGTGQFFTSLTNPAGLFYTINAMGALATNVAANITSDLNAVTEGGGGESGIDALNSFAGGYSLTIQPSAAAQRVISGTAVPGIYMIGINANNVTIDGESGGDELQHLLFRNTNLTQTSTGATIQFNTVATGISGGVLKNCAVENNGSSTLKGAVVIGTPSSGTNTVSISGNNISNPTGDASGYPANGIYSGSASNLLTISGNNVYNFSAIGIDVAQGSSSGLQVTGNSIYQTIPFTTTTAMAGITIGGGSGNGFTLQGNFIGGSASALPGSIINGTWNCASSSSTMVGIQTFPGSAPASNIKGNVVAGISFTTSSTASSVPGVFAGIYNQGGVVNIGGAGTGEGNTIGIPSTSPVTITCTASGSPYAAGIDAAGSNPVAIYNNTISAITCSGMAATGFSFDGIRTANAAVNFTIDNNHIGGSASNDITIGTNGTTTAAQTINGILLANSSVSPLTVQNNVIQNITSYSTGTTFFNGIYASGATSGTLLIGGSPGATYGNTITNITIFGANSTAPGASRISGNVFTGINLIGPTNASPTIQGNTISNITSKSLVVGSGIASAIVGIYTEMTGTSISIDSNVISVLTPNNTSSSGVVASGITLNGSSTTAGSATRNKIFNFDNSNTGGSIMGINTVLGSTTGWTVVNNMITMATTSPLTVYGIRDEVATSGRVVKYYFNSVYIGGTTTASSNSFAFYRLSQPTVTIQDNMFVNERSGGTGHNYCIFNVLTISGWASGASDYNILGSTVSNSSTIGNWGGTVGTNDKTFTSWQNAGGSNYADVHSYTGVPSSAITFTNTSTGDLHITSDMSLIYPGTPLGTPGTVPLGIDIDGQSRDGTHPDMGADEYNSCGGAPVPLNLTGSVICSYPGNNGTITSDASQYGVSYQLYNQSHIGIQSPQPGGGSGLTWSNLSAGNGYYVIATNGSGCTSSSSNSVNVTTNPADSTSSVILACDSFNLPWGGSVTSTGSYSHHYPAVNYCDSVVTINLTVNYSSASSTTVTACGSYIWNDSTYTTSVDEVYHTSNAAGCDSAATLHLTINNGSLATYYRDLDGDGFGNPNDSIVSCSQPAGYVSNNLDCNDNNAAINPNTIWYQDMDGDGYYADSAIQCSTPTGSGWTYHRENLLGGGDCDDNNKEVNPGFGISHPITGYPAANQVNISGDYHNEFINTQMYIEGSTSNDGKYPLVSYSYDLNTNTLTITLSAGLNTSEAILGSIRDHYEICNGIDDNCNGQIDEDLPITTYFADHDYDGYGGGPNSIYQYPDHFEMHTVCLGLAPYANPDGSANRGWSLDSLDCNDDNAAVFPTSGSDSVTACAGYYWNGTTYIQSGVYTYLFYNGNANGCDSTATLNLTIVSGCTVTINLKMFIGGYYQGRGLMTQVLYNEGVDPNPYSTNVDTIVVSLVDSVLLANDPDDNYYDADTVATAKGVLQTNGALSVTFPGSVTGHKYYLMITHRNVVQTWSANTLMITNGMTCDFTVNPNVTYGSNVVDIYREGIYSFYSGDLNQDGGIDGSDFLVLYPDIRAGNGGYLLTDINGDGGVDGSDFLDLYPDIIEGVGSLHP